MAREKIWLRMTYYCCAIEWTDDWPEPFKVECPDCSDLVEAHLIVEIGSGPKKQKRRQATSTERPLV